MPRKADTLDEQREQLRRTYKNNGGRGRKVHVPKLTDLTGIDEITLAVKKEQACFLKAADYSYSYISDATNVTREIIRGWFSEPEVIARYQEIHRDHLEGLTKYAKTYALELWENLIAISYESREKGDYATALRATESGLDRIGMSKVNKSESVSSVTNREELDLVDSTGLLERLEGAPPDVQRKVAEQLHGALAMAQEHAVAQENKR